MNENEIGGIVVDCAVKMHMRLGPGLQESVYEAVLSMANWNDRFILLRVSVPPCEAVLLFLLYA